MGVKCLKDSVGPEFLSKRGYLMSPLPLGDGWDEHYYVLRGSFLRKHTTGVLIPFGGGPAAKLNDEVEYTLTGSLVRDIPNSHNAFEVVLLANRNHHGTTTSIKFACCSEEDKKSWTQALRLAASQRMVPPEPLVDIAHRMLNSITCKDRRHHIRVYKQCFRGNEGMAWLVKETGGNCKEACDLATHLSDCGLVYHVTHKRDLCDGFNFFRFAACLDDGVEGNGNVSDVPTSVMLEEEAEEGASTDSEDGKSSNTDMFDLMSSLDVTCSILESSRLSVEDQVESIRADISRKADMVFTSLGFVHILLMLLAVWLLFSNSFSRWSLFMSLTACIVFLLEFFALRAPCSLSVMRSLDTKEAKVILSSISPSSHMEMFQQPGLEEKSDVKGRKMAANDEPLRQTQMVLPPAENVLDVAGPGSIEKEISGLPVPRSHGNELAFLPPLSEWEQWPVMFRISPSGSANNHRLDCTDPFSPIRINCNDASVPFETPLFYGRVIIRMAGLPGAEDYFRGRKRLTDFVVQGQFRRPVRFDRLMTGQRFSNKLKTINGRLARVMSGFIKALQPSVEIDLLADSPFWLNPVATTAQALQVELEGKETDITGDIKENTILLGSAFSNTMSSSARKKYFSRLDNLRGYSFEPGVVWTFDFYQHYYDAVKNRINSKLKYFVPHCKTYIGHQPISLMAADLETGEMAC